MTKFPRVSSTLISAGCFAGAYWYIDHTLWLADTRQPERIATLKILPLLLIFALVFLMRAIAGERFVEYSKGIRGRKKTAKDFAFFAVVLIPTFAAYGWMVWQLKLRGYEIL